MLEWYTSQLDGTTSLFEISNIRRNEGGGISEKVDGNTYHSSTQT